MSPRARSWASIRDGDSRLTVLRLLFSCVVKREARPRAHPPLSAAEPPVIRCPSSVEHRAVSPLSVFGFFPPHLHLRIFEVCWAIIFPMKNLRIALGLGWLMAMGVAHAGPPFVTDDPGTPPAGGWEINVPFILERSQHELEMEAPLLDLNYGAAESVQLKLEIPSRVIHEDGNATMAGPGDLLLGMKWRFFEDEKSQVQLAIYPQVLVPTGDPQRGLGDGGPGCILPLVAQKTWGKWTLFGNVGGVIQTAEGKRNYLYEGVGLTREIGGRLSLGGELYGNSSKEEDNRSNLGFNLGGTWKLREHMNLLFSAGHSIQGDSTVTAYLGLQFLTQ